MASTGARHSIPELPECMRVSVCVCVCLCAAALHGVCFNQLVTAAGDFTGFTDLTGVKTTGRAG